VNAQTAPIDADLQRIIDVWPGLPETIRRRIVGMIEGENGRQ